MTEDVIEASEILLRRQLPLVADIRAGQEDRKSTGQFFLPSTYSEELGAGSRSVLLRSLQEHYRSQEKEVQEEVCLIQGAKLILGSDKGRLQKFSERDCVLVNLSQQFVMNIEVVESGGDPSTVLQRLAGTKELLEDFFGGEMRDGWRFLAMLYTPSLQGVQVCEDCRDFVMEGPGDIPASLARAAGRLCRERQAVTPSPGVYRTLVRTLCFFVQAAPWERSCDTVTWGCYSPSQLSLIQSRGLRFAVLHSQHSQAGKTECLAGKALQAARRGDKVLMVTADSDPAALQRSQERFESESNVTVVSLAGPTLLDLLHQLRKAMAGHPDRHTFVDSLTVARDNSESVVKQLVADLVQHEGKGMLWIAVSSRRIVDVASILDNPSFPSLTFLQESELASESELSKEVEMRTVLEDLFPPVSLEEPGWFIHEILPSRLPSQISL